VKRLILATIACVWLSPAGLPAQAVLPLAEALERAPAALAHAHLEGYLPVLSRVYAARQFQPLWTEGAATDLSRGGQGVLAAMSAANVEGLEPDDYFVSALAARPRNLREAADRDVLLSVAAVRYAHDLGWGVTLPSEVDRSNSYASRVFDPEAVLARIANAADPGRELQAFAPATPAYTLLKQALASLRSRAATGWTSATPGPTLRLGDAGPRVSELRRLLTERGDLASNPGDDDRFDQPLETALEQFQHRHGLEPDGVAGPAVIGELNVPLTTRIQQVRLGLERLRWLPPDFTGRRIGVNLADFKVYVLDGREVIYETRAVVGRQFHETPMFAAPMTYVVINPYWNVPPSIARAEILPKAKSDPGYLARNHMEVVGGSVRQRPGPWNALGYFKFMFPNAHNVYLHDTPSRNLFDRADRAFSHGCVRVQHPADLAAVLLKAQGWTPERIDAAVKTGEQTVVTLATPIPVHITYVTAFLDTDGLLHYRRDVYGRDRKLVDALAHRGHGSWER
jgi:murein L,D-transpeptidase YcbB/YkuD